MIYEKSKEGILSEALFKNPTSEYRGTPFWAWNTKLDKGILSEQIKYFKEMGFGGFHMHPRTGMQTPYLSEAFMELVAHCVDEAEREDMLAWLYDEDRWPSGYAGGLVTKEPRYRARYLLFTKTPYYKGENYTADGDSAARGSRTGKGTCLASYDVKLDSKGYLQNYKQLKEDEVAKGEKWYAYLEVASESEWFNNQTYVDTLNKEAIQKFIQITYGAYHNKVGDRFGKVIPAIFTDEPQFTHKTTLDSPFEGKDIIIPWTDDLADTYKADYQEDLLEKLPELFWELDKESVSPVRYHYHNHVAERFAKSFADQCGKWCMDHNLLLTGHMMEEPTLNSQTAALGEAMRSYRSFSLPGIDILCDSREYTTAKQAQSAAHQFGREGVLSELYGVTNWDFDFRGHKLQGDWQAALGVTVRVPHLTWVSMEGEAKRDYPASIGYQSPWYKQYAYIEDYFARVNTALTRGVPDVKIGVIHPIESYWLHFGPREQTQLIRECKEQRFREITEWLLFGLIDFDFIAESLLPTQCKEGASPLEVGKMRYDVIIVPECETLRKTTYERLVQFKAAGGRLIFLGEAPKYMDALPSEEVVALYHSSEKIPYCKKDILEALEENSDISIVKSSGERADSLLYQMRQDGDDKWLFICQGKKPHNQDIPQKEILKIKIKGIYKPVLYEALTGEIEQMRASYDEEYTVLNYAMYQHDSLLIKLEHTKNYSQKVLEIKKQEIDENANTLSIAPEVPILLEEPNVYLLDVAEYKLDDGTYEKEEEILRLDNKCRMKLGYPLRGGQVAQPWTLEKETLTHQVTLRFKVISNVEVEGVQFAAEKLTEASLVVNGEKVEARPDGWFVDRCIQTVPIPKLLKGENEIEITYPFGKTMHLEWCYLLGAFGVEVRGRTKAIVALPQQIGFGDWTVQGLPFYAGNLSYKLKVEVQKENLTIQVPQYRGALIAVFLDGREVGKVVFSPYKLKIENISPGIHEIEFKLYGNRINAFGAVHNSDESARWFGPDGWRTTDERWCYEYRLQKMGILTAPCIKQI